MKMQTPDELGFWAKLAVWAAGIASMLAAIVWKDAQRRVEKVEEALDEKADKDELDRQRDNITALFEKGEHIEREMNKGFQSLAMQIHNAHVELLHGINKQ